MLCDEGAEAQPLVQLADEDQAAIGGDPQSLELDLQRGLERELKGAGIVLSSIGYAPPQRHRRAQTCISNDIRRILEVLKSVAKEEIRVHPVRPR